MWPTPQFPADLVTITEEILNEKLHFLCSVIVTSHINLSALIIVNDAEKYFIKK